MKRVLMSGLVGALFLLLPNPAHGQVWFGGCNPNKPRIEPGSVQLICSASLRADGIKLIFRTQWWDVWSFSNRTSATGTAIFPEGWVTGKYRPCGSGRCSQPMISRPARIRLTDPTSCSVRNQLNRARVWIEETKYAVRPWDSRDVNGPFRCARPKLPPRLERSAARYFATRAMRGNPYVFFRQGYNQQVRCRPSGRLVAKCKVKWFATVRDNGGKIVVEGKARGSVTKASGGKYFVRLRFKLGPVGPDPYGHSSFGLIRREFR